MNNSALKPSANSPRVNNLIAERSQTIAALRKLFYARGLDVAEHSDDAISNAVLADVNAETSLLSPARLAVAFQRLVNRRPRSRGL